MKPQFKPSCFPDPDETLRPVKDARRLWPLATCDIKNDGLEISV